MVTVGEKQVSRFAVEFVIANDRDRVLAEEKFLPKERVRRMTMRGVVDSGAAEVVLPKALALQLGLSVSGKAKVTYADRRTAKRDTVDHVYIEIQGRSAVFTAILEPKRTTVLIGAIVLEALDFLVDCKNQVLVPRDPHFRVSEIETVQG